MPGARWGARMAPHSPLRSSAKAPTSSIVGRPTAIPRLEADRGLRRVRATSLALSEDDTETSPSRALGWQMLSVGGSERQLRVRRLGAGQAISEAGVLRQSVGELCA
jgi:hypothetical protein